MSNGRPWIVSLIGVVVAVVAVTAMNSPAPRPPAPMSPEAAEFQTDLSRFISGGPTDGRVGPLVAKIRDKSGNKLVREAAIKELAALPTNQSVPALIGLLKAEDGDTVEPITARNFGTGALPGYVRYLAAEALGKLGPGAIDAVPSLAGLALRDEQGAVRGGSTLALARIAPRDPRAVEAFVLILRSRDTSAWALAALALGEAGGNGKPGLPELERLAATDLSDSARLPSLEVCNAISEAKRAIAKIRAGS